MKPSKERGVLLLSLIPKVSLFLNEPWSSRIISDEQGHSLMLQKEWNWQNYLNLLSIVMENFYYRIMIDNAVWYVLSSVLYLRILLGIKWQVNFLYRRLSAI